ncbi:EGF-like domain protein, partial [Ancylostoma caninum]
LLITVFSIPERKCNSTCNDRGACLYDGEKAQCYCNSGFSGPTCEIVDKNECHDKPCHWLAHCQNTVGSYECACFPGFHGDGYQCAGEWPTCLSRNLLIWLIHRNFSLPDAFCNILNARFNADTPSTALT